MSSPPKAGGTRTSRVTHSDGHARRKTEFVDEPPSVAGNSIISDASNTSSFAELVVASTSTVLRWWDQEGVECAVTSCDHLQEEEGYVATDFHHRFHPNTDDSQAERHRPDPAGHVMETNDAEHDGKALSKTAQGAKASPEIQKASTSVGMIRVFGDEAKTESYRSTLRHVLEYRKEQRQPSTKPPRDRQSSSLPKSPSAINPKDPAWVIRGKIFDEKLKQVKYKSSTSSITDTTASANDTASSVSSSSSSSSNTFAETVSKHGRRWVDKWESFVKRNGDVIAQIIASLAREAAKNPYTCILSLTVLALGLLAAGFFTNFHLVVDNSELWPPRESFSVHQAHWLYEQTNFTYDYRNIDMIVHADGDNVLTREGISRVFAALNVVREMEDYKEGCKWADLLGDDYKVGECHIHSVGSFWNHTEAAFLQSNLTDSQLRSVLSGAKYPSGQAVDVPRVIGNAEVDSEGVLLSAQSFFIEFDLPWSDETEEFEWYALQEVLDLQREWNAEENNVFRLEVEAYRSYEDEFLRAIWLDLPLLPAVFIVVCMFCCIVFWRHDKVHSRTLLGIGAVVTILLSIMTSFGLMFLCGVPFTTSTSMLPFLMFGIGLDDSFIIIGSYNRTHGSNIMKRIEWTMKDVSVSICITTLTSALAFALGCFSDIPSVRWLCIYACPSFLIDFFFQVTFFISLIVLDERRIQENRRDCCVCMNASSSDDDEDDLEASWRTPTPPSQNRHWADRFMGWYADKLLQPIPQAFALVGFFALLAGSLYAVLQLEQHFDMNDMVPHDSYMRGYYSSLREFGTTRNGIDSYAFFRDINQSDIQVQQQMLHFVENLANTGAIASSPPSFWLRDFLHFTNESGLALEVNTTFAEQVETFLKQPLYNTLYDDHITRDSNGEVIASRCEIYINVDVSDAKGGIAALERLRNVSKSQPINAGLDGDHWKMFTYQDMYNLWEFYMAVLSELSFSTIIGVVAVCVIGLLLVPHWSAVFFVAPMIVCLYVDMLGYISYTHVNVNAISYVQLVMSIGLMVDYIMHILMRYYECKGTRKERVKETLQTMGSSIFLGGVSSLLGVSLLAFSTSEILQLVFIAVLGLVYLGILHGLVFLPVILSLIGPL